MSTTFKKLQCAKAASLPSSRDSMVHHLASQKTLAEASTVRQNFNPYPLVYTEGRSWGQLEGDWCSGKECSSAESRQIQIHLEQCIQELGCARTDCEAASDRAAGLWAEVVTSLPENTNRHALNSVTDTLLHTANLHL